MIKRLKTFTGLTLSALMAVSAVTNAFAATNSSSSVTMTGTIASSAVAINVTVPTNYALTLKPYGEIQIYTPKGTVFKNNEKANGTTYKIQLSGYTSTTKSKNAKDPIVLKDSLDADPGEEKQVAMKIQFADACAATTATTAAKTDKAWAALFSSPVINEPVGENGEGVTTYKKAGDKYNETSATYKNTVVEIPPTQVVPFRITGDMNDNANWVTGDSISVVPVFKVSAKRAEA
jgi:hypothetical protein